MSILVWPASLGKGPCSPTAPKHDFNFAFLGEGWGEDSAMNAFAAALFFANTGINFRWEFNDQLDLAHDIEGCNGTAGFASYSTRKIWCKE